MERIRWRPLATAALAACGRYSTWTGWDYHADYGCFPVALGGKGAEAPAPGPTPAAPTPADSAGGGGKPAPAPVVASLPVSAPPPRSAPGGNGGGNMVASSSAGAEGQAEPAAATALLPEEPGVVGEAEAPVEAEAVAAPPSSLPEPVSDRLAARAEGERERGPPVIGHLAQAWKRVWGAISSLLERLR